MRKSDEFFNSEQKNKFLATLNSPAAVKKANSIFRAVSPLEKTLDKDLCMFNAHDIGIVLSQYCGIGSQTLPAYRATIRSYYEWSYEHDYTDLCEMPNAEVDKGAKIRSEMVSSPRQLANILDSCFDPVGDKTIDCIYRCFYWFAFSGMYSNDAVEVKIQDIDLNNMRIIHQNVEYELYKECLPALSNAIRLEAFKFVHPKYVVDQRPRVQSEYVLRGFRTAKPTITSLRPDMSRKFSRKGVNLSYSNTRLSGIYYRVFEAERAGERVNFQFEAQSYARGSKSTGKQLDIYVKNIAQSLEKDYEAWKVAFQI